MYKAVPSLPPKTQCLCPDRRGRYKATDMIFLRPKLVQSTATQAYVLAQRPVQEVLPTAGFHLTKLAKVILYRATIVAQFSPVLTKWNVLQLFVIPDWIGEGVEMPLPGLVGVGVCPIMEMQIYCSRWVSQVLPRVYYTERDIWIWMAVQGTHVIKPESGATRACVWIPCCDLRD